MVQPDSSSLLLSRRDAVRLLGLGTAFVTVGLGSLPGAAGSPINQDRWSLPKLDYGYDALEPHIDAETMEIHHTKHHQAYLTAAKKVADNHPEILRMTPEEVLANLASLNVPDATRTTLRNQVGGHVNHTFFWKLLSPTGGSPEGVLSRALEAAFGSFDEFKEQFNEAAGKRFGSGWAWLSVKGGRLAIHSTANQDSPLLEGAIPVLGLDVWEHAYYLHYQNRRADYAQAFWKVVNWKQAGLNYTAAMASPR